MRIEKVPGEFFFKALFRPKDYIGWNLSNSFYASEADAKKGCAPPKHEDEFEVKWPVEIDADGFCFVPDEKELSGGVHAIESKP